MCFVAIALVWVVIMVAIVAAVVDVIAVVGVVTVLVMEVAFRRANDAAQVAEHAP